MLCLSAKLSHAKEKRANLARNRLSEVILHPPTYRVSYNVHANPTSSWYGQHVVVSSDAQLPEAAHSLHPEYPPLHHLLFHTVVGSSVSCELFPPSRMPLFSSLFRHGRAIKEENTTARLVWLRGKVVSSSRGVDDTPPTAFMKSSVRTMMTCIHVMSKSKNVSGYLSPMPRCNSTRQHTIKKKPKQGYSLQPSLLHCWRWFVRYTFEQILIHRDPMHM